MRESFLLLVYYFTSTSHVTRAPRHTHHAPSNHCNDHRPASIRKRSALLPRQVVNAQLKATFSTDWSEQFSSCEDEALGSVFTACFGEGGEEEIRLSHEFPKPDTNSECIASTADGRAKSSSRASPHAHPCNPHASLLFATSGSSPNLLPVYVPKLLALTPPHVVVTCSYEEQLSLAKLRQVLEERLEDYNMEPKLVSMQLVLFKVHTPNPGFAFRCQLLS